MKNKTPFDTIVNLLEIINYTGDKNKAAGTILDNIHKQTILDLINALDDNQRDSINRQLESADVNNNEEIASILSQYFSKKEVTETLNKTSESAIKQLLESIENDLNEEQKMQLTELSSHISV